MHLKRLSYHTYFSSADLFCSCNHDIVQASKTQRSMAFSVPQALKKQKILGGFLFSILVECLAYNILLQGSWVVMGAELSLLISPLQLLDPFLQLLHGCSLFLEFDSPNCMTSLWFGLGRVMAG